VGDLGRRDADLGRHGYEPEGVMSEWGVGDVPLVQRVRGRLDDGTLPREFPEKVWSGPALYEQGCSGCGDQILGAQRLYVFSLADLTFAFHIGCYGLWLGELVRRGLYRPT
jgi:hypothetical protein